MTSENINQKNEEQLIQLKYSPKQAVNVLIPVCICMLTTVIVVYLTKIAFGLSNERENFFNNEGLKQTFVSNSKDSFMTVSHIIYICLVYIGSLIGMTLLMLLLIHLNWNKALNLILSTTIIVLFLVSVLFWVTMAASVEFTIDALTASLFIYNHIVLAYFSVMCSAPKILNQIYQIYFAVLIAWYIDTLTPIWIGWAMLVILSIWDLFAVLPEYGPLNMIIKILDKRGQKLPNALIYSIYLHWPALEKLVKNLKSNVQQDLEAKISLSINQNNNNNTTEKIIVDETQINEIETVQPMIPNETSETDQDIDDGPKLGIGDFVFYSVLIAKSATQLNLTTILACYLTIIVGLTITMTLVAYLSRPLPALPISIFLAIIVFFGNEFAIVPFYNRLSLKQNFI